MRHNGDRYQNEVAQRRPNMTRVDELVARQNSINVARSACVIGQREPWTAGDNGRAASQQVIRLSDHRASVSARSLSLTNTVKSERREIESYRRRLNLRHHSVPAFHSFSSDGQRKTTGTV